MGFWALVLGLLSFSRLPGYADKLLRRAFWALRLLTRTRIGLRIRHAHKAEAKDEAMGKAKADAQ